MTGSVCVSAVHAYLVNWEASREPRVDGISSGTSLDGRAGVVERGIRPSSTRPGTKDIIIHNSY